MRTVVLAGLVVGLIGSGGLGAESPTAALQAPGGEIQLGSVQLPRAVLANGQRLAAGTYDVRLTTATATPDVVGQNPSAERWVEFLQGGQVQGREVASIVAQNDISVVADGAPPARGQSKVEMLKDNEFVRVWIHREDSHYLIHMPPA